MGIVLSVGGTVTGNGRQYQVVSVVNLDGAFADAYEATCGGTRVFLKQYKDPSVLFTPWFQRYKAYQDEVIVRLNGRAVQQFVIAPIAVFVADNSYFQVHPWDAGRHLRSVLASPRDLRQQAVFESALVHAQRFVFALARLHDAQVVHADLKPENVLLTANGLIPTPTIRVVDFDWSILADRVGYPWGDSARGTRWYMSPEHLRGERVVPASDVFTAALIVYELLYGVHPISDPFNGRVLDEAEAFSANLDLASRRSFARPTLPTGCPGLPRQAEDALWAALSPAARSRPTADELHKALTAPLSKALRLKLVDRSTGLFVRFTQSRFAAGQYVLGRQTCRLLPGSQYVSAHQADVRPNSDASRWFVCPPAVGKPPTNPTLVNGVAIGSSPRELYPGDHLQVGEAGTGPFVVDWVVDFEPGS